MWEQPVLTLARTHTLFFVVVVCVYRCCWTGVAAVSTHPPRNVGCGGLSRDPRVAFYHAAAPGVGAAVFISLARTLFFFCLFFLVVLCIAVAGAVLRRGPPTHPET